MTLILPFSKLTWGNGPISSRALEGRRENTVYCFQKANDSLYS